MSLNDFLDNRHFEDAQRGSMLSDEQIASYNRDGFLVIPKAFDPELVEPYLALAQRVRSLNPRKVLHPHKLEPKFAEFADRKVRSYVEALNHGSSQVFESFIFYKTPGETRPKPWHQDGVYWNPNTSRLVAAFIPLTRMFKENGCLHVIPGTHRLGRIYHRIEDDGKGFDNLACDITSFREPVAMQMEVGDLAFVHTLTVHGSFSNTSDKDRVMLGYHFNHTATKMEYLDRQKIISKIGRRIVRSPALL